ncbi:MAG: ArnT family glycosyltransferase, partial [Nitrospirales bacterium]
QMPSNGELFPLFLMSLGHERFLSLACLPFTLLAILAVYSLARRVSDSYEGALLAALGFGTMPIVLYNTFDVEVDMFAASFFLSSTCLLVGLFRQDPQPDEKRLSLVAMAGLAFGLGLGARYIYVPLLLLMTGLCVLVSMSTVAPLRANKGRQVILTTVTFVVGSLLPSVFWYARNFMATGNPMHPLRFSMGAHGIKVSIKALSEQPRVVMPHVQDASSCLIASDHNIRHWLVAPWEDCWSAGWDHYSENWGLGAVFTTFVPVMTIAVVLLTIATIVRRRQVQPLHILLLVATVFLTYWWLNLYTMVRSILPVIGILFVVVAFGIGTLSSNVQRIVYGLFLCAMIANGVLLAAKPLAALGSRLYHQSWSHSSYYEVSPLIDELPAGSVILNASDELRNYPLFGRRWQNRVITDRALLEPTTVSVIGNSFIEQWGIEYIYYGTSQKWTLGDEVKREVLSEQIRDDSTPQDKEILYRILR